MPNLSKPFGGEPPPTIPLANPPLARVLAQVRFSTVLSVAEEAYVAPFQKSLVKHFPRSDPQMQLVISGPEAPSASTLTRVWRFTSDDEKWSTSLGTQFVALETTAYHTQEEFFSVLRLVMDAVREHIQPTYVERVGIRYIQRLDQLEDLHQLGSYFIPEVLGISRWVDAADAPIFTMAQAHFVDGATHLAARWGIIPPKFTIDVSALPPVDALTWILDLDTFDEARSPLDTQDLQARLYDYSRRQYQFFRWAIRPAFLLRFGADPELVTQLEESER